MPAGTYGIQVTATDDTGNSISPTSDQLAAMGLPSDVMVDDSASLDASAGLIPGNVVLRSPVGTSLDSSASTFSGSGLPAGALVLVGDIGFSVTGLVPGSSTSVSIQLPAGSDPTNVLKLVNGTYVDVSSIATISGNAITLHLTDGGFGDEDGVANGTIVDPIVPVREQRKPTITSQSHATFVRGTPVPSPSKPTATRARPSLKLVA